MMKRLSNIETRLASEQVRSRHSVSSFLEGYLLAIPVVMSCLVILSVGCINSSLRDFSFLKKKHSDDQQAVTFDSEDAGSLTIWHNSFEAAQEASVQSGKPILADFTGSDWCGWCIKLKRDVFKTSEFQAWARDNVVLLELDYPQKGFQPEEIQAQNRELKDRYKISSFPTVLLLDSQGEIVGKMGYKPDAGDWIKAAESQLRSRNAILAE